jgi:hypothetical protein
MILMLFMADIKQESTLFQIQMQEDGEVAYTYRGREGPVKVIRGRGCNESFRAAVDRSYEAPLADIRNRMETCECFAEICNSHNIGRYVELDLILLFQFCIC